MQTGAPLPTLDGKYQLLRQLGEGGMGAVYEARHTGTGRRVALKVIAGEGLAKSEAVVARFRREAMASGSIESQHIAQVLDTGVDPRSGSPYMVMELLVGEDVQGAIQRVGPLAPELALRLVAQACLGLQKAHEAGVVHRDIKPANLFIARRDGGELVVKLLDFGIAKLMNDPSAAENHALTRTGSMLGSPLYMSPEQARGKKTIDHRTDVWSLGVVLFEALCGTTPHGHVDTLGELIIQISTEAPRNVQDAAPWVPPQVAAVVHGALALDPAHRFASAQAMFDAIRPLVPQGIGLAEWMFAPLPQATRALVAQRYMVDSALRAPPPVSSAGASVPDRSGAHVPLGTGAGLAQSQPGSSRGEDAPKRRSGAMALVGGAIALTVVAAISVVKLRPQPAPAPAATPVDVAPVSTPATQVAAPAPPSTARTVLLAVAPDKAQVEVDGQQVAQDHGAVSISGTLGSSHHVRLSLGKSEVAGDVAIADDGPVPAKLELTTTGAHGSHGGHAPLSGPSGGTPAATSAPSAPAPAAASPAPAAPKPSPPAAPTVSRDFN